MSAHDDDRVDTTSLRHNDRDNVKPSSATPPGSHVGGNDASPTEARPTTSPTPNSSTTTTPPSAEVTTHIPFTDAGTQRGPHGTTRSPQPAAGTSPGSGYPTTKLPPHSPAHPGGHATEMGAGWPSTPTAGVGNPRAADTLFGVGARPTGKTPPRRGWRRLLHRLTGINLGMSAEELRELDLHARIRRHVDGAYQIGVFGLKGGVGKTAVTVTLGSTLSEIRGDRILAIDADPNCGNLAERVVRQSGATVADLLSDKGLARYNDIRAYTSINDANLEVLSSEEYSSARREFNDGDWKATVGIVSQYYNLVLADCGSGMFQPASRAVLSTVSGLVIVASASIDGARQAAVTMDWLRQNGYQDLLRRSCVVINHVHPGKPNVDVEDLVAQFERHVQAGRVVVLPWDKHISGGLAIQLELLSGLFRERITQLAAALSDDFDRSRRR